MKADRLLCSAARTARSSESNIVLIDGMSPPQVVHRIEDWANHEGIRGKIKLAVRQQPEFFPSWKLIGQLRFMAEVSEILDHRGFTPHTAFIATDYDAWADKRFRRAELPALATHGSSSHLNITPSTRIPRATLITFTGPIPDTYPAYFADQVSGTMNALVGGLDRRLRHVFQNVLDEFIEDQSERLRKARDWPAFCVDHIASVTASPGTESLEVTSGYEILAARQSQLRELVSQDEARWSNSHALWSLCSRCGVRFSFVKGGQCPHCRPPWRHGEDLVLPKVVLDDLLEETLDHGEVLFSHVGGLAHLIGARRAGAQAGIRPARLHLVSDRGRRRDHLADHIVRHSITGAQRGHQGEQEIAALIRKAGRGEYSTIYYLLGEKFTKELAK